MKYTTLGHTDPKVSRLCIGCMSFGGPDAEGFDWTIGYEDSKKVIDRAINLGINFFDTADVYSNGKSEQIVGKALQRRSEVVLATKVGLPTGDGSDDRGLGRKQLTRNLKRSLANLRTDRIDLYQIHRWDYDTPIDKVLRTLTKTVRDGKVDHLAGPACGPGNSRRLFTPATGSASSVSRRCRTTTTLPTGRKESRSSPWSPVGRGFLTGKYRRKAKPASVRYRKDRLLGARYFRSEDFDVVERLEELAREKGINPAQLALA